MTTITSSIQTNLSNMSNFKDFIIGANASASNYLFTAIDFLVFFILFITMANAFGWESAMLSAGFISMILTILFVYMGVMPFWIAGFFIAIIIIFILYIVLSNRYD